MALPLNKLEFKKKKKKFQSIFAISKLPPLKSLVEIGQTVLDEKILNFVNVFLLLHNYLP